MKKKITNKKIITYYTLIKPIQFIKNILLSMVKNLDDDEYKKLLDYEEYVKWRNENEKNNM